MNCSKCGSLIPDGTAFCVACGTQTGDPTAQTMVMAIPEDPLMVAIREEMVKEYAVERELGRGGMAIVYKATEVGLQRPVALKVLPPDMALAGGTAERFKREARLAARMEHPNIIPIYRVGQIGRFHYMAMKFVEGRALDVILETQGALPIAVVLRILRDSAKALAFAHDAGIIHRDIKGGNILIDKDGRVLVSDFGIARAVGESALTASGMMVGTPTFMSPEQCGAGAVGPQSDQYSLGILGFQILTGQLPFESDSLVEVIQHHYSTPPPDLSKVRSGVPAELLAIVNKMLSKHADARYASTHDLVDALGTVPVSDAEKREATAILKQLSMGEKIAEVRTASVPPAKLSTGARRSIGDAATATLAKRGKKRSLILPAAVIGGAALAAAAAAVIILRPWAAGRAPDAATVSSAAQSGPGLVTFEGLPPGARVVVNDQVLPGGRGLVPAGTHPYRIAAAGFRELTGTVTVTAGEPIILAPSFERTGPARTAEADVAPPPARREVTPAVTGSGKLRVAADQVQAEILLDGRRIGTGRVVDETIPAGRHGLRVQLPGFLPFDTTFTVEPNETKILPRVVLKAAGGP